MEQVPTWLAAAVTAAGLTTVYNAEDWDHNAGAQDKAFAMHVDADGKVVLAGRAGLERVHSQ